MPLATASADATVRRSPSSTNENSATCTTSVLEYATPTAKLRSRIVRRSSAVAAICANPPTRHHAKNESAGTVNAFAGRDRDDREPQRGERQPVQEAHERRAQGPELRDEMALRRVAYRLRERGKDGDGNPQHGAKLPRSTGETPSGKIDSSNQAPLTAMVMTPLTRTETL